MSALRDKVLALADEWVSGKRSTSIDVLALAVAALVMEHCARVCDKMPPEQLMDASLGTVTFPASPGTCAADIRKEAEGLKP